VLQPPTSLSNVLFCLVLSTSAVQKVCVCTMDFVSADKNTFIHTIMWFMTLMTHACAALYAIQGKFAPSSCGCGSWVEFLGNFLKLLVRLVSLLWLRVCPLLSGINLRCVYAYKPNRKRWLGLTAQFTAICVRCNNPFLHGAQLWHLWRVAWQSCGELAITKSFNACPTVFLLCWQSDTSQIPRINRTGILYSLQELLTKPNMITQTLVTI